jgi:predicted SprT family Zn-dependent metalloprotease
MKIYTHPQKKREHFPILSHVMLDVLIFCLNNRNDFWELMTHPICDVMVYFEFVSNMAQHNTSFKSISN